ncbi:ANTAR domain-containing protein [Arthrobacter sp. MDT1-65]
MTHASDHSPQLVASRFPADSLDLTRPSLVGDLSDREAVIALMVASGRTCQDIASDLVLPLRTVQGHLYQAMTVLGLSSVEELTYEAVASHSAAPATAALETEPAGAGAYASLGRYPDRSVDAPPGTASKPSTASHPGAPTAGSQLGSSVLADVPEVEPAAGQEPHVHAAPRDEVTVSRALLQREIEKLQQLQEAVTTRDAVGQAKGILMERHKISAERAFAILKDESTRTSRRLSDVAQQLVHAGQEER